MTTLITAAEETRWEADQLAMYLSIRRFDCNLQKNSGLCYYVTSVFKTSAVHKDSDFNNRQLFKLITGVEDKRMNNLPLVEY